MNEVTIPWAGWELCEPLGSGGFGTVYRIVRPMTSEESAMKVLSLPRDVSEINALRVEGYDDRSIAGVYQNQLSKIINEYTLMAQMKGHPNVVRCEDCTAVPHADGIGWDVFIRMELLCPLTRYLMQTKLDEGEVIRLGTDLCCALALCESKSIIHRDIKPENIFISDYGVYKLGDFGIARTMDHTTMATHAGSYRYIAPEVYKNERYGKEVDIYSLGMTLYWLLNNRRLPFLPPDRPPMASENEQALQLRLSGVPLPPPASGSDALKAVVLKACAYDPRDRFRTAEEMLRALESARDGVAPAPEYDYGSQETVLVQPAVQQPAAATVLIPGGAPAAEPKSAPKTPGKAAAVKRPANTAGKARAGRKPVVGWELIYLIFMTVAMAATYIAIRSMNQRFQFASEWWEHWMVLVWIPCMLYVYFGKKKSTAQMLSLAMGIAVFAEFLVFAGKLNDVWYLEKSFWEGWDDLAFYVGIPAAILTFVAGILLVGKSRDA